MTTATKKAPAIKKASATKKPPTTKKVEKGTLDYLELALENLNKAREHAQQDVRSQIDTAVDRIRGTIGDVRADITARARHGS